MGLFTQSPFGQEELPGQIETIISSVTTAYTILPTDTIVNVDHSAAAVTLTLPDATTFVGALGINSLTPTSSHDLTLETVNSQTILASSISGTDASLASSVELHTFPTSALLYSNGSNWVMVNPIS